MVSAALVLLVYCGGLGLAGEMARGPQRPPDLSTAERLYSAGRFAEAHRVYSLLQARNLNPSEKAWIEFRLADTGWRAEVARHPPDEKALDAARESLEMQSKAIVSSGDGGRVSAEISESLGRLWLERPRRGESWDYPQRARPHLAAARKWWMENPKEPDRDARFLALFWLSQKQMESSLPVEQMREALSLARSDEERAHLHLLIATATSSGGRPSVDTTVREYEAGLAVGPTKWKEQLLSELASFLHYCGKPETGVNGDVRCHPDNDRALALYGELKAELVRRKTSPYWAEQEIAKIAGPIVIPWIRGAFLPGQPVAFSLRARNVDHCDLALYALRPGEDLPRTGIESNGFWTIRNLPLSDRTPLRAWRQALSGPPFEDFFETIRLDALGPGMYLLHVRSAGGEIRWPLLVSDMSILLTRAGDRASLLVTKTSDGAAIAGADVTAFRPNDPSDHPSISLRTDERGIVVLPDELTDGLFVARKGDELAILTAFPVPRTCQTFETTVPVGFVSKSDYRPGEDVTVLFQSPKGDGVAAAGLSAEASFEIRVGSIPVSTGTVPRNEWGAGHTTFQLDAHARPGIYRIRFSTPERSEPGLERSLFRVVEESRSDFKVDVIPTVPPTSLSYGGGSSEVLVRVTRGGQPVPGALLELTILRRAFRPADGERRQDHVAQFHTRLTGKTDDSGKAVFSFFPGVVPVCDFEYEFQAVARGPDDLRGSGRGWVRSGASFHRLRLDRHVVRPGEKVSLRIATFDSQGNPARLQGVLTAVRSTWTEAWRKPDGTLVRGDALRHLRVAGTFLSLVHVDEKPWQIESQPTTEEKVLSLPVDTGMSGVANVVVPAPAAGRIEFRLTTANAPSPLGETEALWVVDEKVPVWGYQPETIEIRPGSETARPGESVPIAIATPLLDRDVLLTVNDASGVRDQLVHVRGNVTVVPVRFPGDGSRKISVSAVMIAEGLVLQCQKEVRLDPDWHRLRVDVAEGRVESEYQPVSVSVKTRDGRPVRGEVSVALLDRLDESSDDVFSVRENASPPPIRQTSLRDWPPAESIGGIQVIQPSCGRSQEFVFEEGTRSCEPRNASEPENAPFFDPGVARLLFHEEGLPTDANGQVHVRLPRCPASSECRLKIWASGPADTFGFVERNVAPPP